MITRINRRALIGLFIICQLLVSVSAFSQESVSIEEINKGWGTKTINNVINGSLGIMLERFDQTWPTWMVGVVRETMEKGLAEEVLDEETELTVTVDTKNGFVCVGDAGTDGEYMSACYWNRPNGHKLLAVLLGKPTDPCIEVLCTYDYDPQKKALIPEPSILKGYRWGDKGEYQQIFCNLPRTGKNVTVEDWSGDEGPVVHTFTWDGTKPVYSKTEPLEYDDGLADIPVSFRGAQPNIKDFVAALLARNTGESMNGLREAWKFYKNGMKQMPGDDLIVDVQNGYVGYESVDSDEDGDTRQVIECCFWNYADKKHKLVAVSNDDYMNGKPFVGQYTGLEFFIYDNASRTMKVAYAQDLGAVIDVPDGETVVSHALPRKGKTMIYTIHTAMGKIQKRLTWNGSKFIPENK
jgi:hypothetical protein